MLETTDMLGETGTTCELAILHLATAPMTVGTARQRSDGGCSGTGFARVVQQAHALPAGRGTIGLQLREIRRANQVKPG